jgi:molybdopterin-binding protein
VTPARKQRERLLTIGEAARSIGVSIETLRRWDRDGQIKTVRDPRNRRLIPEKEVRRLRPREPVESGTMLSARNSFDGVITAVEISGVMALVEIKAGDHCFVSVITRDAVEELGLAPGVPATATVKATSVMVARRDSSGEHVTGTPQ